MHISQEKLAELADVSVQMIKGIEGRRTWVSDRMLTALAEVLEVEAFQLLLPPDEDRISPDNPLLSAMLLNIKQNLQDTLNAYFDRLIPEEKRKILKE